MGSAVAALVLAGCAPSLTIVPAITAEDIDLVSVTQAGDHGCAPLSEWPADVQAEVMAGRTEALEDVTFCESGTVVVPRRTTETAAMEAGWAPEPVRHSDTIVGLEQAMARGDPDVSSEELVDASMALIATSGHNPASIMVPLNAVISVNEGALDLAETLDAERAAGHVRGPLHGLPILIKDNIETAELPTTAGSLALIANAPGRDAPLVARLRAAGAIILGKANLSEWANIRSSNSVSGWSAVGGLTRNPYALDRSGCGSSTGSAAAVAAGIAPAAIGTETDGSITCPAAANGVVGFKPTVGLVSRTHIIPISESQDTAGPITRSVEDAAIVLTAIAGSDPLDPRTMEADLRRVDYRAALDAGALEGARLGVMRFATGYHPDTYAVFEQALQALRDAGAELVEIPEGPDLGAIGEAEFAVLLTELKAGLNAYLASTDPAQVPTRTLADVIAFNAATPAETALFGQEFFLMAEAAAGLDDPAYLKARDTARRLAGPEGIDRLLTEHDVVALVAPTGAPAWTIDVVDGDHFLGSASRLAAVAGYPHLTVPMGFVDGLPVGLSFVGAQWDDARILSLGHAFEQRTRARRPPAFLRSVEDRPEIARALAPTR